jgi:hypothetical protein
LISINIQWNKEVHTAFKQLEEGIDNALQDYNAKQNHQLEDFIMLTRYTYSSVCFSTESKT